MKHWKLILLCVLLVAAGLRFYGLGAKSLWLDEALSWRLQTFPIPMMIQRTGEPNTVHPPLYFILLHFWTGPFGDSEFALRSLSGVAGVLTVLGMFLLVRELTYFGAPDSEKDVSEAAVRAGLAASALAAFSAYQIHLSQQVRGYSLGMLLFVMSSVLLLRALHAGKRRRGRWLWASYALLALAFCYTHSLALFSVAAQGVFVLFYLWRAGSRGIRHAVAPVVTVPDVSKPTGSPAMAGSAESTPTPRMSSRWQGPVLAGALLVVGYLPWVPNLLSQSEAVRTSWQSRPFQIQDYVDQIHTAILLTSADRSPQSESLAWGSALLSLRALRGVA